jgi:hypothetical protein
VVWYRLGDEAVFVVINDTAVEALGAFSRALTT